MEKIEFEDGVFIYQTKIVSEDLQNSILKDTKSFLKITQPSASDSYGYISSFTGSDFENEFKTTNSMFEILKLSVLECVNLIKKNEQPYNRINFDAWVNVVRTVNPKQYSYRRNGTVDLHNHIDIQKKSESFHPTYTFVYYIQMPDNLSENDGTLIIGGKNKRYYFLPEIGDLIIMDGGLPHGPNLALNSTKDRIVIAGNVGFEYLKQKLSLI
jgi:hypothetical protein